MIVEPLLYKHGYKIEVEVSERYRVICPRCGFQSDPLDDFDLAQQIMNEHARLTHKDFLP